MTATQALPADHWAHNRVLVLDTETTGLDPETARIASISAGLLDFARPVAAEILTEYIAVDMPAEAGAVNGLTTERLAELATTDAATVLEDFASLVAGTLKLGMPVVIANAPYDLTVLDRECRRHGLRTITDRVDSVFGDVGPVIDPIVLDKRVEKYRKRVSPTQGARCLKTICQVHGVGWDDEQAHTSAYDALRAGLVVAAMLLRYPQLRGMSLPVLHARQREWHAEQAAGLRNYFVREARRAAQVAETAEGDARSALVEEANDFRDKADSVSEEWPIRSVPVGYGTGPHVDPATGRQGPQA
jgi:DNA polymerase-3 subunit epsilon